MPDLERRFDIIHDYLSRELSDDPVFDWILGETASRGIPSIQITPIQGRFLYLLAHMACARRILEVGSLGGYSTVWLARALSEDGLLIALEASQKHADLTRESLERAGVADRAKVIVGPALETMSSLSLDGPLDLVFIDADKGNNLAYFDWATEHVRPGGLVLVDNVLFNGRVATCSESGFYASIRALNDHVFSRYPDQTVVVPFFKKDEDNLDGLMIVRMP